MTTDLEQLTLCARADLTYVDNPAREWPAIPASPDGLELFNVVVVGAGLNGLATAFGLMRRKIGGVLVVDAAPDGQEGPWVTFARMRTLRTGKEMVGPDLAFPSLSFPAWYRAAFGQAAWQALDKAPNEVWMDYLGWFRRAADIPVRNDTRLTGVAAGPFGLRLSFAGRPDVHARQLVFAVGVLGAGGPVVPAAVAALPKSAWAHGAEDFAFSALAGKRVAVIGAGASAFDNAACALEAGAARVTLLARRAMIEQPDVKSAMHFSGFLEHFADLTDQQRVRLATALSAVSVPPPASAVERCTAHGDRFETITGAPFSSIALSDAGAVRIAIPQGTVEADFVIAATGYASRVHERPELGALGAAIVLWRDRVPEAASDPVLGGMPYLGRSFEYQSSEPELAEVLARMREVGQASLASMGPVCTGLGGIKFGASGAVEGISRALFLEQAEMLVQQVEGVAGSLVPVTEPQFV